MKIHFIGIGGIGVSALAQYYLAKGHKVSGSDSVSSEITKDLEKKGAKIFTGKHKAKNVPKDADLVIYSPAVQKNNPELKKSYKLQATSYKLQVKSYPQALGDLTKEYFTIAVCGTHGKSTTTAMIALVLIKAGFNPTVILGTKLKEFGNSNFRMGGFPKPKFKIPDSRFQILNRRSRRLASSKILLIEADEWQASFLNYWPKLIVLNNIEKEHLDYYKNLEHILKTYKEFIGHLPEDGVLVVNGDDINIQKIISNFQFPISNQFSIFNFQFSKQKDVQKLKKILKVPGEHNIYNTLAALTVARVLKIPDKISFKALAGYKGAWRRFEIFDREIKKSNKLQTTSYKLISDYAHHPTEIAATLKAAREKFPKKKIWCIFQPHQKQRTFYLFDDFVKVFVKALKFNWVDKLILTKIYDVAGREKTNTEKKISSKKLVQKTKIKLKNSVNAAFSTAVENVLYISDNQKIIKYLKKNLKGGEVVIIMGAGDIYKLADELSL